MQVKHAVNTDSHQGVALVDALGDLVIRDLKDSALAHFPSGDFAANSAWAVIGAIAHNLGCWTNQLGLAGSVHRRSATLRRRLFAVAGRLTQSARQWILHLPARWPWQQDFIEALTKIRALPACVWSLWIPRRLRAAQPVDPLPENGNPSALIGDRPLESGQPGCRRQPTVARSQFSEESPTFGGKRWIEA